MKQFTLLTPQADYNSIKKIVIMGKDEIERWELCVKYKNSVVSGIFYLPKDWDETRICQLIWDLNEVCGR